jgi:hypothetical protein
MSFIEAPKQLVKDRGPAYYDFYGQHVSIIHSIVSLVFCAWIYIDERGLDYHSLHD